VSRLEASLFRNPRGFAVFFPVMAVLLLALGLANRFYFYPRTGLVYEESPEQTFISLRPQA
jgi:hypothetical protein